jgi:hypothetical protein
MVFMQPALAPMIGGPWLLSKWNHAIDAPGARATAVSQLRYLETTAAKWLFFQEKATSQDICKGMRIVEPL